jgi:hypothetical protein
MRDPALLQAYPKVTLGAYSAAPDLTFQLST